MVSITSKSQSFDKFKVDNPTIHWAASTNQLKAVLWVYKVYPQEFSVKGVNNLLKAGGFTNRTTSPKQGISVVNSSNTCSLMVNPQEGFIRYWNHFASANHWDKSNHLWEVVRGLPSQKETERLGLKFLKQFGIERKDLAQREDGHLISFGEERKRSYFDRRKQKNVDDEILTRGIFFNRRIDGVNFAGIGIGSGCEIEFGNAAKISKFNLVWRNLQPYEQYKTKAQDEIKQSILAGDVVLTHKNFVDGRDVKSITITDCSPLYMGADEDSKQDTVSPLGKIEAIANIGTTSIDVELYCSILSTNRIK